LFFYSWDNMQLDDLHQRPH